MLYEEYTFVIRWSYTLMQVSGYKMLALYQFFTQLKRLTMSRTNSILNVFVSHITFRLQIRRYKDIIVLKKGSKDFNFVLINRCALSILQVGKFGSDYCYRQQRAKHYQQTLYENFLSLFFLSFYHI